MVHVSIMCHKTKMVMIKMGEKVFCLDVGGVCGKVAYPEDTILDILQKSRGHIDTVNSIKCLNIV